MPSNGNAELFFFIVSLIPEVFLFLEHEVNHLECGVMKGSVGDCFLVNNFTILFLKFFYVTS